MYNVLNRNMKITSLLNIKQIEEGTHTLNPMEVAPGITSLPKSFAAGNFSRSRFNITFLLTTYIPMLAM